MSAFTAPVAVLLRALVRVAVRIAVAALLVCGLARGGAVADEPYRVAPGDEIALSVYGQPELSGVHRVREDGALTLHLIGRVPVAGLTLPEVDKAVGDAAEAAFKAPVSVLADIATYRDVYVLGEVDKPGAYPFRQGLSVVKAMALAGGLRRADFASGEDARRVADERRHLLQGQAEIAQAKAAIAAIDAELARLDAGGGIPPALAAQDEAGPESGPKSGAADDAVTGAATGDQAGGEAGGEAGAAPETGAAHAPGIVAERGADTVPPQIDRRLNEQLALIRSRRSVLEDDVEGARRKRELATEEAELYRERAKAVARQLAATEANLADIEKLVQQGLARATQRLNLVVDADEFRADALEIAAFEARAKQSAADAESEARTAVSRYRADLVSDRITAGEALEAATIDFETSLDFLRYYGETAATIQTDEPGYEFEIIRDGETLSATETTPLRPSDVLRVVLVSALPG